MEPTGDMQMYRSRKLVRAGRITEVVEAGCYVENADGSTTLRLYDEGMTVRYKPVVGDYWIVYDGNYQSLSPKAAFEPGYVAV